ncbi:hypothetical protein [Listeria sp. ILCC792]|uniref:hypothetical protein n=1 Tax=Listeria sp. ILCC792 TaxID=1918331 RepID=UPI000B594611|nr:hypothetical protein [Listeria sp. ILCC792]
MIDVNAPIIPYESMGGVKLYSTIKDVKEIITGKNVETKVFHNTWIVYSIDDSLELFFDLLTGKLFKIVTLGGYKGTLFGKIKVGMKSEEFLKIESSFVYDDFEEIYETKKGVYIETEVVNDTAKWISIFVKEIDSESFRLGEW